MVVAALISCRAQVTLAATTVEALEQLAHTQFDVPVTDIGLPEEDGYSLIMKVRQLPAERGGEIGSL